MWEFEEYVSEVDEKKEKLWECSDFIFDHPEFCFEEYESSKYFKDFLESEGFTVADNLGGIKTAVSGRFGHGKPVIGILGEYDALSGLSQKAGCDEKCPVVEGGLGHGCGHNYLGTAAIGAALAVKKYLEKTGKSGTVICYGCPAEEGGSGKTIMAREGVFDELDVAVAWHPASKNSVITAKLSANKMIKYIFDGKAAHAAGAPFSGRSALDAVELMNVGVQFLREHMPRTASVHYAITDTGGFSPNVVQPHAEVVYLIRDKDNEGAAALTKRVDKIAEGAAMMTETKLTVEFQKACSNTIQNSTLQEFAYEILKNSEPPVPTEEDKEFVRKLLYKEKGKDDPRYAEPFDYEIGAYKDVGRSFASSDVGDVSWVCPVVRFNGASWGIGSGAHNWQTTAQGKSEYGKRVMSYISKLMASTAIKIAENPDVLKKAQEEHKKAVGDGYVCPY